MMTQQASHVTTPGIIWIICDPDEPQITRFTSDPTEPQMKGWIYKDGHFLQSDGFIASTLAVNISIVLHNRI